MKNPTRLAAFVLAILLLVTFAGCVPAADPLPSWREGAAKAALVRFVTDAVTEGAPGYIPPTDRVVVTDMDGTLLRESDGDPTQPESAELELTRRMVRAERTGDAAADVAAREATDLYEASHRAYVLSSAVTSDETFAELNRQYHAALAVGQAGMTQAVCVEALARHTDDEYADGRSFAGSFYTPMLELYRYLRANGFAVYVVSGSTRCAVAALTRDALMWEGELFPYERCLGVELGLTMTPENALVLTDEVAVGCYGDAKPVNVARLLGRTPVLAIGNSTGDAALLDWTRANPDYAALAVLLTHDDDEREHAYNADETAALAAENGWLSVSMAADFAEVFAD